MEDLQADLPVKEFARARTSSRNTLTPPPAIISERRQCGLLHRDNLPDNSYTISEDDPYAALAQAAADAAPPPQGTPPLSRRNKKLPPMLRGRACPPAAFP